MKKTSAAVTVAAVMLSGVLSAENLIKNGGFEDADSGNNPVSWTVDKTKGEFHRIDSSVRREGARSFMMGGVMKNYDMTSQGGGLVKDFKGAYRLSAWVRTEGVSTENPTESKPFFGIWTTTMDGRNSGAINILSTETGNAEWKKHEMVITEKDILRMGERKSEETAPCRWTVRLNMCNQPGKIWIDDVVLEKVEYAKASVSAGANEITTDATSVEAVIEISSEASDLEGKDLRVEVSRDGKAVGSKTFKCRQGKSREFIPVSGLTPGDYSLTLGEGLGTAKFKVVEGAF